MDLYNENYLLKKSENKFDPNKLSINVNDNEPALKDKIQLEQKEKKEIEQNNIDKKNRENKLLKEQLFDKYRRIKRKEKQLKKIKSDDTDIDVINSKKKEQNLKKIYRNISENIKSSDITLLVQNGPKLIPENLIKINDLIQKRYSFNTEDGSNIYDDLDGVENNIEKSKRLKRTLTKNIKYSIAYSNIKNYKKFNIPEEYWNIFSSLNLSISNYNKYNNLFKKIEHGDGNNIKEQIVKYIIKNLSENNITYDKLKDYIEKYYDYIEHNVTPKKNLITFIILYQTFIVHHFWFFLPEENKFVLTYMIDRIFQTIDEGVEDTIKIYDNSQNGLSYDIISNDTERDKLQKIKLLDEIQSIKKSDRFLIYRQIYKFCCDINESTNQRDQTNHKYIILSNAKYGILRYLLVSSLFILFKRKKEKKDIQYIEHSIGLSTDSQTPETTIYHTNFIKYMSYNLDFILEFLYSKIKTLTKDTEINSNILEYRFFKYLIREFKILYDLE